MQVKIFLGLAILLYYALIINLILKSKIYIKYALLWLGLGVFFVIFTIWPGLLNKLAGLIGVANPINALFAVLFFFLFLILISLMSTITRLNKENRKLTQEMALIKKELLGKK